MTRRVLGVAEIDGRIAFTLTPSTAR